MRARWTLLLIALSLTLCGCQKLLTKLLKQELADTEEPASPPTAVPPSPPPIATREPDPDPSDPTSTAVPTATAAKTPPSSTGQCKMTLKASEITSTAGVTDRDVRTGATTTLTFPCEGGSARAAFGKDVFTGSASKAKVQLREVSTYTAFGCPWQTTQTITGTPPTLQYSYTEKVVDNCKTTARPTTAAGTLTAAD